MSRRGFLKPQDEDFAATGTWKEDRQDLDSHSQTAFVYNASPSLALNAQRAKLPIAKYKNQILYMIEKFQVLIVVGETGCGKSTQLPQFLIEAGWCSDPGTMVQIDKL